LGSSGEFLFAEGLIGRRGVFQKQLLSFHDLPQALSGDGNCLVLVSFFLLKIPHGNKAAKNAAKKTSKVG
jgi:hypothetical protein